MKKWYGYLSIYVASLAVMIAIAFEGNRAVSVISEQQPGKDRTCVIIDAGHGGVDGGAVSCTGIYESQINLEIALKLDDLLHLLGIQTYMIRTDDRSIYTDGHSIASQKVSDLKERVRIANSTDHAVLISIHQNTFPDSRYKGAQVFYGKVQKSKDLASKLQESLIEHINPGSNRKCKQGNNIYLLEKVNCTAVLIECGFISNHAEEALLRDKRYQQQLCSVIAATFTTFLSNT